MDLTSLQAPVFEYGAQLAELDRLDHGFHTAYDGFRVQGRSGLKKLESLLDSDNQLSLHRNI